jgi:phosphoglycerate dehydrogenase-like enzyme
MTRSPPHDAAASDEESSSSLPLVLAVNCLLSDCEFEKAAFKGMARFQSVSFAGGGGASSASPAAEALVEEASVLVLLTLQDLHPALQQRVFIPSLVILLTTANQEQEILAAEQFGVQRLLQVPLDTTDELADTCVALMLDLLRRTHAMAHAVQRGVWTPSLDSLAGMRKCRGLQLGLVGLGPVAMGVAKRVGLLSHSRACQIGYTVYTGCRRLNRVLTAKQRGVKCQPYRQAAAFGMRVVVCDPMEGQGDEEEEEEEEEDDREGGPERGEAGGGGSGGAGGASSSSGMTRLRAASRLEWAEAADLGVARAESLQELLETSDVVSLHAPANRVTAEMICEETLTWFKRGAQLVNVTSGALVNAVGLYKLNSVHPHGLKAPGFFNP